jgi:hypothetical protein
VNGNGINTVNNWCMPIFPNGPPVVANSQRVVGYSREKAVPNPCNSKKNGCAEIGQVNLWQRQLVLVYFWMITRERVFIRTILNMIHADTENCLKILETIINNPYVSLFTTLYNPLFRNGVALVGAAISSIIMTVPSKRPIYRLGGGSSIRHFKIQVVASFR